MNQPIQVASVVKPMYIRCMGRYTDKSGFRLYGALCMAVMLLLMIPCPFAAKAQESEKGTLLLPFDKGVLREVRRDSVGLLWVATHNGLLRYDGHRLKIYEPGTPGCDSLKTAYFYSILPIAGGDLLLGTQGQGLLRYSALYDSIYQATPKSASPGFIEKGSLRKMLWLGEQRALLSIAKNVAHLAIYDMKADSLWSIFQTPSALASSPFLVQDPTDKDVVWFTTDVLTSINVRTGVASTHAGPYDVSGKIVMQSLAFAHPDTLMLGTLDGLKYYVPSTGQWTQDAGKFTMAVDMAGLKNGATLVANIPLGVREKGVYRTVHNNAQPITCLHTEGNMAWAGVINEGVYLFNFNESSLPPKRIHDGSRLRNAARLTTAAQLREGKRWYAAFGSLPLWAEGEGGFEGIEHPEGAMLDVMDFVPFGKNKWLLATHQGLWEYDIAAGLFEEIDNIEDRLQLIFPEKEGSSYIVIGTKHLYRFKGGKLTKLNQHQDFFRSAAQLRDSIFVLNQGNIALVGRDSLTYFKAPFDQGRSMTVHEGSLWVCADYAMYRYSNGQWLHKPFAAGKHVELFALQSDDNGRIWGLTAEGLAYFNAGDMVIQILDKDDGLPFNDVSGMRLFKDPESSGKMLLGMAAQVLEVDPERLVRAPGQRPIFTGISVMGVPIRKASHPLGCDTLRLDYTDNYVRFNFAAPYFTKPQGQVYHFTLEGYEEIWHHTDEVPEAYYTGLPPGNYKLKVRPADAREGEQTLEKWLIITPPFWQTTWFKVAMAALLLALFAGFYFFNIKRIRREEALRRQHLMEVNTLEMKAIRAQMNPHFIFNCLNSIRSCIMEGKEEVAINYIGKFGKLMRLVLDLSRGQKTSLKDEIDMLKLYIELEGLRMSSLVKVEIDIDPALDLDYTKIPGMVLQPFVENALWHGLSKLDREPKLSISFTRAENGMLKVTIQDNGHGRQKVDATAHVSHAMQMVHERLQAETLSGKRAWMEVVDLKDGEGRGIGTRVEVHFSI